MSKDLEKKAISIQGKKYILVSDRVKAFNEDYPDGSIVTEILPQTNNTQVFMKAIVTPDLSKQSRFFTGHAQEVIGQGMVNKTSALENAETSAVGRALGLMGIGVLDSIASADEIHKAVNNGKLASEKQLKFVKELLGSLSIAQADYEKQIGFCLAEMTSSQASKCIGVLKGRIEGVLAEEGTIADKRADDFLSDAGELPVV